MIITFFGHSDYLENKDDEKRLLNLIQKVSKGRQIEFYLGGYGNFDRFVLRCAKQYKETYINTKIIFITPYLDNWLNARKDYLEITYDEIIYPELEKVPKRLAILKRNEWMITRSDYIFYYVKRYHGGAYNALLYGNKIKKPYMNLYQGNL